MNRKIIGICGLAGSGKDTIGDILVENLPNWEKLSFASHLKDVTALLFGWDRKMLAGETPEDRELRELPDVYWTKKMKKPFTPRMALQILGTNLLREQLYEDIWVACLERKIMETNKNVVITDVRFPNEIDMIRNIDGEIWRVERGELPFWYSTAENLGKDKIFNNKSVVYDFNIIKHINENVHQSEWKWVGYDNPKYIFKNDSTIEKLKESVLKIIGEK